MSVYALAQLTIHDRDRYQRYAARFLPILHAHGGRLLAADDHPEVLEGAWDHERSSSSSSPTSTSSATGPTRRSTGRSPSTAREPRPRSCCWSPASTGPDRG